MSDTTAMRAETNPDVEPGEYQETEGGIASDDQLIQGLVEPITEQSYSVPHDGEAIGTAHNDEQRRVLEQVKDELAYEAQQDRKVERVSTNYSRQVQFRTYTLTTAGAGVLIPVRIIDDKPMRGDTVIYVSSGGAVSIGRHIGIMVGGSDTVSIPVGGSRTVRTSEEVWAITATSGTVLDVQEEFD